MTKRTRALLAVGIAILLFALVGCCSPNCYTPRLLTLEEQDRRAAELHRQRHLAYGSCDAESSWKKAQGRR